MTRAEFVRRLKTIDTQHARATQRGLAQRSTTYRAEPDDDQIIGFHRQSIYIRVPYQQLISDQSSALPFVIPSGPGFPTTRHQR
jgi:hypothetical protein